MTKKPRDLEMIPRVPSPVRWGAWDGETQIHIMPCDAEGFVLNGHQETSNCPCEPVLDLETITDPTFRKSVWAHHEKLEPPASI